MTKRKKAMHDFAGRTQASENMLAETERRQDMSVDSQIKYGDNLTRKVSRWNRLRWSYFTRDHELPRQVQREGAEKISTFPTFARESFTRLITGDEAPRIDDGPVESQTVERLHSLLDELPEWKRLIDRCSGDEYGSGLGASTLIESALERAPQHKHDLRDARLKLSALEGDKKRGREVDPDMFEKYQREYKQAEAEAKAHLKNIDESAIRQAFREGIAEATQDLDELDEAMSALGCGSGDGVASAGGSANIKRELAEKLEKTPAIKKIMKLAGRFRFVASQVQTEKIQHGAGELSEIESGRSLDRMLPSELVTLTHPRRRLDFYRRWLEGQTLQYRLEDRESVGLGPIVVCIDDSGSMRGDREVWAKAIALALMDVAKKQKRAFAFCTFSHRLGTTFELERARDLAPLEIVEALIPSAGGGTNWEPPIGWAQEQIMKNPKLKKADVIFITDDQCALPVSRQEIVNKWREDHGARIWGVAIDGQRQYARNMKAFCDRVYELNELVNDEDVARSVLSV